MCSKTIATTLGQGKAEKKDKIGGPGVWSDQDHNQRRIKVKVHVSRTSFICPEQKAELVPGPGPGLSSKVGFI